MARHEIRDQTAILSRGGGGAAELQLEGGEGFDGWFRHQRQRGRIGSVPAGDLEQAAGVMLGQLVDVLAAPQGKVHAHARGHEDLLYARLLPGRRINSISGPWSVPSSWQIVGWTQLSRRHLRRDLGPRAVHLVHVRRRAADVADRRREKSGSPAMRRISSSTDSRLRLWMIRPSWAVIEQNVQPPKQPRMICIESFTTS